MCDQCAWWEDRLEGGFYLVRDSGIWCWTERSLPEPVENLLMMKVPEAWELFLRGLNKRVDRAERTFRPPGRT